jgi:hypothetical protein
MPAGSPQHRVVLGGQPQPGPDPRSGRPGHRERGRDLAQPPARHVAAGRDGPRLRAAYRSAFRAGRRPYRRAQNDVRTNRAHSVRFTLTF